MASGFVAVMPPECDLSGAVVSTEGQGTGVSRGHRDGRDTANRSAAARREPLASSRSCEEAAHEIGNDRSDQRPNCLFSHAEAFHLAESSTGSGPTLDARMRLSTSLQVLAECLADNRGRSLVVLPGP